MRARIRNYYDDSHSITVYLPVQPHELYDMLDRINSDNKYSNVYINIEDECIPKEMREGGFYDDIFKLNLLAQRLGKLSQAELAGFTAVLLAHDDYNLDDLILVTYGLDAYPIYPCGNYAELGEVVIDNNMIPEVENCPDELVEHLDRESIGRLAAEQFKGTFVDGYYCEVADFELPDMEITIGKPSRNEFQILVGEDEKAAQWIALPCADDMTGKTVFDIRSPLPNIKAVDDISKLNEVSERIAELDSYDFIKLKAIMESRSLRGTGGALCALDSIYEFELDWNVRCVSDYCREYLRRQLPENFDMSVMNTEYLISVGWSVLDRKEGTITSYGAISGRGQQLYSAITVQEELEEMEMIQ